MRQKLRPNLKSLPPRARVYHAAASGVALGLLVALCAGCPAHTPQAPDSEITEQFRGLHSHIYGVYALPPERDAVYDLLRDSFDGDALTREYVEHYTSLHRMQREDTKITILRVDYSDTQVVEWRGAAAVVEADWNVGGVVYHQGHSHARINRYQAIYTVAPTDAGYRIVATRMKNMERVQMDMMTTGFGLDEPLPTTGLGMLSPSDLLKAGLVPQGDDDSAAPAATELPPREETQ